MATGSSDVLREKRENHVSGSESDGEIEAAPNIPPPVQDGLPQTGPKGVLTDFYRTQQDTKRKEVLEEKRRRELIQKHTATVQSKASEQQEDSKSPDDRAILNLAKALEEGALDQDPFVQQYRARRLEEMKAQAKLGSQRLMFGNLIEIRGNRFDNVIETAPTRTFVIMHIYDDIVPGCQLLNRRLTTLAKQFPSVKFCRVQSYQLNDHLSQEFLQTALPAILVYRGGKLVGNLLRVTHTLKDEFSAEDVEIFLHEHNCLPPDSEKEEMLSPHPGEGKVLGSGKDSSDSD